MKKFLVSIAMAIALPAAASAADLKLPVKAAPVQAIDWTGFYVGVQAGGGWGRADQTDGSPFDTGWFNTSGGMAGVTWGFNWQIGRTVVGFESDLDWSNIRGTTDGATGLGGPCGGNPSRCEAELQAFGTTRLRLGYAFGRWLPFVTAGMAGGLVHGEEGDSVANGAAGSDGEFHYGWTVGGGVEAMIDPHWSAKAEYLYADLGNGKSFVDQFTSGGTAVQSDRMQVHIVRVGVNYKFDAGASLLPYLPPNPGPSARLWNWSGLYAGANYGAGAGQASQSDVLFDRGTFDVGGAIAGVTLGYNWQRDNLVYGLEGDLDYSWIRGATSGDGLTVPPCGFASSFGNCDSKLRWLATARARVGVAWDRLLPYVTGGVAIGSLDVSEGDLVSTLTGSGTVTRTGWTAGGGIEAKIDDRWTAKLEYLYVDLGSGDGFTEPFLGGTTVTETVGFRTHILRSGINYRFN